MYLIDGSNLAGLLTGDPENRRQVFDLVMEWSRNRKNRVVLYFDGPPDDDFSRPVLSFGSVTVKLIYPHPVDREILREVRRTPHEKITVTEDRDLAGEIRQMRGKVISCKNFVERLAC